MSPKQKVRGGRKRGIRGRKKVSLETLRAGQDAHFYHDHIPQLSEKRLTGLSKNYGTECISWTWILFRQRLKSG